MSEIGGLDFCELQYGEFKQEGTPPIGYPVPTSPARPCSAHPESPPLPSMATIQQQGGRWRWGESVDLGEYMKAVGVGTAL